MRNIKRMLAVKNIMTKSKNIKKHFESEERNEIVGFNVTNSDFSHQYSMDLRSY